MLPVLSGHLTVIMGAVFTRRSTIASAPSVSNVENVIKALLDGVGFIRNPENKTQVTRSLAKGLRLKRIEDTDEGDQSMLELYERKNLSQRRRRAQRDPASRRR